MNVNFKLFFLVLFLISGLNAKIILKENGNVPRFSEPNSLYRQEIIQSSSNMNFSKIFNNDYIIISKTVFNLVRIVMEYSFIDNDGKKWHNVQAQIDTYSDHRIFAKVLVCDDLKTFTFEKSKGEQIVKEKLATIIIKSLNTGKSFQLCGTIDDE